MTGKAIKILLLIEDNPGDARLLHEMLKDQDSHHIDFAHVDCISAAEAHLAKHATDIILLDLGLPDAHGLEAVRRAHAAAPRIPLVVLTGLDDESLAAQALQEGAQDYLIKGQIEARGLLRSLRYAIERNTMEEALFAEKERAQVTLKCMAEAVICTDIIGNITFLNLVAEKMTGWVWAEAESQPMNKVFRILEPLGDENITDVKDIAVGLNQRMQVPPTCTLVRRDGLEVPIENSIATIHDREGHSSGAVIV